MSQKNGNLHQETKKKPLSAGVAEELMEKNGMDFDGYELIWVFVFEFEGGKKGETNSCEWLMKNLYFCMIYIGVK